ncbi:MAG TPA: cytochrome c3 family protein, partial [Myxococcota bacterium]|nr:cytochrome c3 family protein [Myxococcota bacterium]
ATFALALYLAAAFAGQRERSLFLPGETSAGHHQIELACESCHSRFGGAQALQEACVRCHGEQLAAVHDSHPRTKFTDPRNADRVALLDARLCATCHVEHQPERTLAGGLTLPRDYCFRCHEQIAEDRPSHAGAAFDSCAAGGCHNFHDNQALYEDFLLAHRGEPAIRPEPRLPARLAPANREKLLTASEHDAPARASDAGAIAAWAGSAHAHGGVNCSRCHGSGAGWRDDPTLAACDECHEREAEGFRSGKHGMRIAAGLSPMRPALARLPMKRDAAQRELDCGACHGVHETDTRTAAAEACLGCHDDAHSLAFQGSPHAALWRAELRGESPPGSGVSCASCHMPRRALAGGAVAAHHDQNANLRPNEKMVRSVCLACHGLGFTLDALADDALVRRNFAGAPARAVESIAWAEERERAGRESARREP